MTRKEKVYNVLFLCTGNSARSIMAEVILNRAGQGNFRAFSAGSQPKGHVHPYTLDLLRKLHFDVSGVRSKSWLEFSQPTSPRLDFVFTVCDNAAGEVCPYWPGQPMTAHWGVPDPAAATGTEAEIRFAFADTLRMLTTASTSSLACRSPSSTTWLCKSNSMPLAKPRTPQHRRPPRNERRFNSLIAPVNGRGAR